jgi:hypothetical protein
MVGVEGRAAVSISGIPHIAIIGAAHHSRSLGPIETTIAVEVSASIEEHLEQGSDVDGTAILVDGRAIDAVEASAPRSAYLPDPHGARGEVRCRGGRTIASSFP